MSRRRIDLHRSTIDHNFRTARSLLTFGHALEKQEERAISVCVLTLQPCWYNRKTESPVTR